MAGRIDIAVNPQQLRELEAVLYGIKNGVPRAATAAINRTGNTGRSRIVKRLGQELNLKASEIRNVVSFKKANFTTLEGAVRLGRRGIPLIDFGPTQTKKGVAVRVRKAKGREVLRGTFIARMRSGHIGVFERKSRQNAGAKRYEKRTKGGKTYRTELPIKERYGPTPLGVFENAPGVAAEELANLGETLQKNLSSQVQRLLAGNHPDAAPGE